MMNMGTDKLYFYSKSKDMAPGKGANELVADSKSYKALSDIKDWRRILSNFHVHDFVWNGYTWRSIEHAFQGAKIGLASAEKMFEFTVESGSELGLGDGLAARKARKLVVLNPIQLKQWGSIKEDLMYEMALEKYRACEIARFVLKGTGEAELWHIEMRASAIRFHHLERIRAHSSS